MNIYILLMNNAIIWINYIILYKWKTDVQKIADFIKIFAFLVTIFGIIALMYEIGMDKQLLYHIGKREVSYYAYIIYDNEEVKKLNKC